MKNKWTEAIKNLEAKYPEHVKALEKEGAEDQARMFLALHNGSCSVPADSPYGHTFAGLQLQGEVELRLSGTAGYVDVYVKGYTNEKARS